MPDRTSTSAALASRSGFLSSPATVSTVLPYVWTAPPRAPARACAALLIVSPAIPPVALYPPAAGNTRRLQAGETVPLRCGFSFVPSCSEKLPPPEAKLSLPGRYTGSLKRTLTS